MVKRLLAPPSMRTALTLPAQTPSMASTQLSAAPEGPMNSMPSTVRLEPAATMVAFWVALVHGRERTPKDGPRRADAPDREVVLLDDAGFVDVCIAAVDFDGVPITSRGDSGAPLRISASGSDLQGRQRGPRLGGSREKASIRSLIYHVSKRIPLHVSNPAPPLVKKQGSVFVGSVVKRLVSAIEKPVAGPRRFVFRDGEKRRRDPELAEGQPDPGTSISRSRPRRTGGRAPA